MPNPLWGNIFRKKSEEESLAGFLGTVPVFSELKGRDLTFLEALVHVRRYSPQEIVFEEGDPGSGIYIIRTGRIRIFSRNVEGSEEDLAVLGPGDFFGETTLSAPTTRSASARTLESSELIGLFRADLLETIQKNPVIASKLLMGLTRVVSERLQAAAQEIRLLKMPVGIRGEGAGS
jgi:CRP/FNR family cyclic AMP-dependent transcriptional regulator